MKAWLPKNYNKILFTINKDSPLKKGWTLLRENQGRVGHQLPPAPAGQGGMGEATCQALKHLWHIQAEIW